MKRVSPRKQKSREPKETLPISVVMRDGKTTIRQFEGWRFVRFGDVRGKRVAWVELLTAGGDGHYLTLRFQDQTVLSLEITPMFTVKPEYYRITTGDPETIKKWAEIRSER
jgi:hypothetical protein